MAFYNNMIDFERVVAGALLKFGELDNLDISLILEDMRASNFKNILHVFHYQYEYLYRYIKSFKDGRIVLNKETSLDDFIEEKNCTVRERLEEVAGEVINNYFSKIDVEKFKKKKEELLLNQKENLLNEANVLLISDIEEDYDELKKYGFKNIDRFKSIVRADNYFEKYPKELEKYHIILTGNQEVEKGLFISNHFALKNKLYDLRNKSHVIFTPFHKYHDSDKEEFVVYLSDFENFRNWDTRESTYTEVFDKIVESAIINRTLEKVNLKDNKYQPIQDFVNPNRLPLPRKKTDLKILYLDAINVFESADEIANELGLNVTFKEDNNSGLERHVISNLSDYDIIIASSTYSRSILEMNNECAEQSKDTGRELTLLVAYKNNSIYSFGDYKGIGDKVDLGYVYGGMNYKDQEEQSITFRVLRYPDGGLGVDQVTDYKQSERREMQSILEQSVYLYNEILLKTGNPGLVDLDFKTAKQYEEEYAKVEEEYAKIEKEKKLADNKAIEEIQNFDSLRYYALNYLKYKNDGLMNVNLDGVKIAQNSENTRVEIGYQGRVMCAITFANRYNEEKIRVFSIQTLNNKGNLSSPETVGLYTKKYENLNTTPKRPDERQMKAILSIKKKLGVLEEPLKNIYLDKSRYDFRKNKR